MEIRIRADSIIDLEQLYKKAIEALKKKIAKEDMNIEMVSHSGEGDWMIDPIG